MLGGGRHEAARHLDAPAPGEGSVGAARRIPHLVQEPSGRWEQLPTLAARFGKGFRERRAPGAGQSPSGWAVGSGMGAGLGVPAPPRSAAQSQATLPVYTV